MSWIAIAIAIVCLYLAFKVAGFVFKLGLLLLAASLLYWFAAPALGWPLPL
jgi:hypothetical protein